ncbi:transglutaminase domain-containing protein [Neorhodopirellula pilleata]|uniref:Protein-glutamine gamma-glutamyltransferase n=1 Tax=Neorhodopirellula pilleata TaxID=2714738 RepID=A0A5C5ZXY6_9BACT|nr:transglutaminase domain-containing protein [Neorhodopirellula pilleata]TWT91871.1 Protein-glutamine gamma-glutamyltransferase [Neorhodopirellula pilleata]
MSRPDTRKQTMVLAIAYGVAFMILSSAIASVPGVVATGLGAVAGVYSYRWLIDQTFRNAVPALIALAFLIFGLWGPAWIGQASWVASLFGISATLVLIQSATLAITSLGVVMLARALNQSSRVFSMIDGLVMVAAICGRFAAHRNYHWGHPRFLADWAGIEGYELPFLFVLLGLVALSFGLIAGMRITSARHAALSVISVLLFFMVLMWLGGRFLRNPTSELIVSSGKAAQRSGGTLSNDPSDQGEPDETSDGSGTGGQAEELGAETEGSGSAESSGSEGNGDSESGKGSESNSETQPNSNSQSNNESDSGNAPATNAKRGRSGRSKSDDPMPSAANQSTTPEPIALVLLEKNFQPVENAWYFRQTAVSLFNGKRLVTASEDRFDDDIPSGFSSDEVEIVGIPLPENMHDIVPLVVNLIAEQPRPFSMPSMISFAPMRNPDPEYFRQSFRAESCVLTDETVEEETFSLYSSLCYFDEGDSEWDEDLWAHYTRGPDDPRYRELAETIIAERITTVAYEGLEDSAMLKTLAIKRWLEKNTTYSHDPRFDDPTVNPAEQFLFGERFGYCVHISHATVYLLRSLGIPARIGTGYMVPTQRNGKSSSILIQSTDAHAWPEIYLDGAGWVVADVSPEKIDESTLIAPEPDPTVGQFLADKARNKDQHQRRIREKKYSRHFPLKLADLPWILLAAIALLYLIKSWIRWCPWIAGEEDFVRVTQRAAILHLAEIGIQRGFGETRSEFSQRISNHFPEFADLTDAHMSEVYGRGRHSTRQECLKANLQTRLRSRQSAGWPRWVIGILDPRFWTLVR